MTMNKIYIGNLSYHTTEDELQNAFQQFGNIETVSIIVDRDTGRSKGFAFVTYVDEEGAKQALALDGTELGGRKIVVNVARPRESGGAGGGGGRGGRFRDNKSRPRGDRDRGSF